MFGIIQYLPHRNVWVIYMGGKIIATRKTEDACKSYMDKKGIGFGSASAPAAVKAAPVQSESPAVTASFNELSGDEMQLREQIKKLNSEIWEQACQMWPTLQSQVRPTVGFFYRGTTAGKAWAKKNRFLGVTESMQKVEYNLTLAKTNPKDFHLTIRHELAHLVVYTLFPRASAHGTEFKRVLVNLGGNGKRCHSYDTSAVKRVSRKPYTLYCNCTEHKVGGIIMKKVLRGCTYKCRNCKGSLSTKKPMAVAA